MDIQKVMFAFDIIQTVSSMKDRGYKFHYMTITDQEGHEFNFNNIEDYVKFVISFVRIY